MSEPIITVQNLSKRYLISHQNAKRVGLRHVLEKVVREPQQWLKQWREKRHTVVEEFWALKNVSFDVKRGDVVGIIGRNGAGKSTLLKVMSRITEPTSGRIAIEGRVASLLEVGTGFHGDLTGRENVFLNGAILGMSRAEIKRKFDEIVAFSEVEKFLDTPVKRYSSGMGVRLAFAVAAHLEPEILIVDEVLAVGDAAFQKKCLGKMQEVSKTQGRTVLFVSHSMTTVSKLCQHCVLMEGGQLKMFGPTDEIIPHYLKGGNQTDGIRTWDEAAENTSDARFKIRALRILSPEGLITGHVDIRKPFTIEVEYEILETLPQFRIGLKIVTLDGTIAFTTSDSLDPNYDTGPRASGRYCSRCFIPANLLNETNYSLTLSADIPFKKILFLEDGVLGFAVEQTGDLSTRFPEKWPGVVCPHLKWQSEPV